MKRVWGAASAAGMALAVGLGGVPASAVAAVPGSTPPAVPAPVAPSEAPSSDPSAEVPSPDAGESPTAGGGLSEAGLAEAALRDLGLTPAEFAAAGQLGKQAADVAAALRDVPGYLGTRLEDGSILVAGSGKELQSAVAKLRVTIPAVTLEAVRTTPPSDVPGESLPDGSAPAGSAPTAAGSGDAAGTPATSRTEAATGSELAHSTQQLYQAYLREVGPAGLQAVAHTGSGFVIRTGGVNTSEASQEGMGAPESAGTDVAGPEAAAAAGKISAEEFVARFANVELDAGARLAPEADVPGGLGYAADTGYVCSTGFAAFDPAGLPAVLTAGHCTNDGSARSATLQFLGTPAGRLGDFGFSQFGGPGNTTVLRPGNSTDPGNVGTDIAVIDDLRPDVDPSPAASTWGNPSEPDPDVKVVGTSAPVVGMPVCRSGRTSAWSCGTIDAVGIFVVPGHGYPADPLDLRAFNGFLSFDVQSGGGDSGGPWLSGNYAVGTHAAGEEAPRPGEAAPANFAVAATLEDALAVLPGYQLELFLNRPTVASPAPGAMFDAGQTISGQVAAAPASAVAAGSKVRVTVAGEAPFEVPVDTAGAWSFTAPAVAGPLRFTAETVNGFSASGVRQFEFAPAPPVPAPVVETPAAVTAAGGAPTALSNSAAVVRPLVADRPAALANTGVSGLLLAAGLAAAALAVGGVLLLLAQRRRRQRATPAE
ncbi:S1 family peptidase [Pseudarthrobacter sp. BIM B-2242]|uniref:S1 family peptidase n=1 Tax=Pseudarthrobacter sp. BIM B-2242 TaxID=2772401 RepID=UPI001CC37923|nr:S1 family peptidase [Pseudarthrobacter sp. BIM B-2242]